MELQAQTQIKISRPPHAVFEAIVNPKEMTRYFISSASGRMEAGKTLLWRWADVGDAQAEVRVQALEMDRLIRFLWGAGDKMNQVEMTLEALPTGGTHFRVREDGWEKTDEGIARLADNTQGWTSFTHCLKAYCEHGINLREGAW